MDIQEIRRLIKIVEKSDIGEIEIIEEGHKIRITKNAHSANVVMGGANGTPAPVYYSPPVNALPPGGATAAAEPVSAEAEEKKEEAFDADKYVEVRSPMVGTFYRAPSPDADPYVEVGDSVRNGQTLCIIEAMKLMNEIQAETGGKISKILVENAQPVEYNQVLFIVEKA